MKILLPEKQNRVGRVGSLHQEESGRQSLEGLSTVFAAWQRSQKTEKEEESVGGRSLGSRL